MGTEEKRIVIFMKETGLFGVHDDSKCVLM